MHASIYIDFSNIHFFHIYIEMHMLQDLNAGPKNIHNWMILRIQDWL